MHGLIKDETGKVYDCLTVIKRIPSPYTDGNKSRVYWQCQCICEKLVNVAGSHLRNGNVRSCGSCYSKGKPLLKRRVKFAIEKQILYAYQKEASKRDISFSLTLEKAIELFSSNCYYCGSSPANTRKDRTLGERDITYSGIDRVDNSKGYVDNNVVSCCKICNSAKNNLSLSDFAEWVKKIYSRLVAESWSEK